MKTLIIAGGIYKEDFVKEYICPDDYNYIIAVDKGLSYTESLNLFPDLIVGDFDSVRNSILSGYDSKIIRRYKPENGMKDTYFPTPFSNSYSLSIRKILLFSSIISA